MEYSKPFPKPINRSNVINRAHIGERDNKYINFITWNGKHNIVNKQANIHTPGKQFEVAECKMHELLNPKELDCAAQVECNPWKVF